MFPDASEPKHMAVNSLPDSRMGQGSCDCLGDSLSLCLWRFRDGLALGAEDLDGGRV